MRRNLLRALNMCVGVALFAAPIGATSDTTPPTVTTSLLQSPNSNGWHNRDVTVEFVCWDETGIAFCPPPVTVTQEGNGIVVSGTAIDTSDNETPASVTLKIDKVAPVAVLDQPLNYVTTTATSFTVEAQITETLSGLAHAFCNDVETPVVNGEMTCVAPLRPGTNTVIVSVVDQAGNSASHGLTVVRNVTTVTSLTVAPAKLALLLGGERVFELVDDAGTLIVADSWTSSDPAVAAIAIVDGVPVLTAVGGGTATITAEYQTLSATATVTVVSGFVLPLGTVQWGIAPLPAGSNDDMVAASPVDSTFYSYFVHDNTLDIVRAIDGSGREVARFPVGPDSQMLFAHVNGGVVMRDGDSLVRIAPPIDGRPWRAYLSYVVWEDVVQAPDGTIYVTEGDHVVAINGETGAAITREYFPTGLWRMLNIDCIPGFNQEYRPLDVRKGVIDSNGRFRLPFITYTGYQDGLPCSTGGPSSFALQVRLLTMIGGSASYTDVYNTTSFAFYPRVTVADAQGSITVGWTEDNWPSSSEMDAYVSDSGVSVYATEAPFWAFSLPILVDLQHQRRYMFTGSGFSALDTVTGATVWTLPDVYGPAVAVFGDGTVAVQNDTTLLHVDTTGAATSAGALSLTTPILGSGGSWVGLQAGEMVSIIGVGGLAGQWFIGDLLRNAGNPQKQGAPIPGCAFTFFSNVRKGLEGDKEYTYRFQSAQWNLALSFTDEIRKAFQSWSRANQSTGHGASFKEWVSSSGDPINFFLIWEVLPPGQGGGLVGGGLATSQNAQGFSTGGTIQFNASPAVVSFLPMTYRKVALHELGHLHGLADGGGTKGSSVMNQLAGTNDATGNIALDVTFCDAQKVNDTLVRSWP